MKYCNREKNLSERNYMLVEILQQREIMDRRKRNNICVDTSSTENMEGTQQNPNNQVVRKKKNISVLSDDYGHKQYTLRNYGIRCVIFFLAWRFTRAQLKMLSFL